MAALVLASKGAVTLEQAMHMSLNERKTWLYAFASIQTEAMRISREMADAF